MGGQAHCQSIERRHRVFFQADARVLDAYTIAMHGNIKPFESRKRRVRKSLRPSTPSNLGSPGYPGMSANSTPS